MPAHKYRPISSEHRYAAVVTLDPAAIADCGVAVRFTAGLDGRTPRGKLRAPDFAYEGSVFDTRMHDDVAVLLSERVAKGERVLLCVEDAIFGARTTARHLGRAIGCLEGVLADLNVGTPDETKYIYPGNWRRVCLPVEPKPKGRDEWKQAAIDAVAVLYGMECSDNQAEAVLMLDYVFVARQDWWLRGRSKGGGKKREPGDEGVAA
jgi:hypothetical protein